MGATRSDNRPSRRPVKARVSRSPSSSPEPPKKARAVPGKGKARAKELGRAKARKASPAGDYMPGRFSVEGFDDAAIIPTDEGSEGVLAANNVFEPGAVNLGNLRSSNTVSIGV